MRPEERRYPDETREVYIERQCQIARDDRAREKVVKIYILGGIGLAILIEAICFGYFIWMIQQPAS